MQTNQNVPRPFTVLMQALAYEVGGIFLFDAGVRFLVGAAARIMEIIGVLFMVVGFFLVISLLVERRLAALANTINFQLYLGLFFVTIADLITVAVSAKYRAPLAVVALVFLLIVAAAMLLQLLIKRWRSLR
jgi:hypothetical protein